MSDDPDYKMNPSHNDTSGNENLIKRGADDGDESVESHSKMKRDGLNNVHVAAYSVGHFNNDLCAAMWFVYLSWYIN